MFNLPVRCTHDMKLIGNNDRDGGWTVARNLTAEQVEAIMRQHPRSAMPCWKRWANERHAFLTR